MMQELTADPVSHALYFVLLVVLVIHMVSDISHHAKVEELRGMLRERDQFIRRMHADQFKFVNLSAEGKESSEEACWTPSSENPNVVNLQTWKANAKRRA
jgi:hypothetical protein